MYNEADNSIGTTPRPRSWRRRIAGAIGGLILLWLIAAYFLIPLLWKGYTRIYPAFDDHPRITQTSDGHPGDPLNVLLIGTQAQIDAIMRAAKWYPAAALGLKSDFKIAADTILSRPDNEAPVSNLFLFGRKEDLAFEQPVGHNPRQRHHVRFWKTGDEADGRPIWIGAASYDERVGLSKTTGQITHHIAPDVDAERDHLFENLRQTGLLSEQYAIDDFHSVREGHNGGGDYWFTDGRLLVGVVGDGDTQQNDLP
jgi:hypothetical protein